MRQNPLTLKNDEVLKSITMKKLDGQNYLAWAHAVKVILCGNRKLKFITDSPIEDKSYDDWLSKDSVVMGWLWHSLQPHVATTIEFCETSQ